MKFTIVYPPTIDFQFMQQRPQRLMEQFARAGHQVYYLNLTPAERGPVEVEANLTVLSRQADIRHVPRQHPLVLWMSWAKTQDWLERLKPDLAVYDCLDDFPAWRGLEETVLPKVDLVVASAERLYQRMRARHKHVVLARNGCDFEFFSRLEQVSEPADWPAELAGQKTAGFVGALANWVDQRLIEQVARFLPVVLVGPKFGMQKVTSSNVYALGMRGYRQLPGYLKKMDVLLIPFHINEVTVSANPVKMYEYLATGKPVVSTAIPEALAYPEIITARSNQDFVAAVRQAAQGAGNNPEAIAARRRLAASNSWQNRYAAIYKALCEAAKKRSNLRETF